MAEPKPLNSADLSERIKTLLAVRLDRLDELLAAGNWEAAVNLINAISADARAVQCNCAALATKVNRKHWSPLLEAISG